jgi:hypothetical protein
MRRASFQAIPDQSASRDALEDIIPKCRQRANRRRDRGRLSIKWASICHSDLEGNGGVHGDLPVIRAH